jgi:hypothetical protein
VSNKHVQNLSIKIDRGFSALQKFEKDMLQFKEEIAT